MSIGTKEEDIGREVVTGVEGSTSGSVAHYEALMKLATVGVKTRPQLLLTSTVSTAS